MSRRRKVEDRLLREGIHGEPHGSLSSLPHGIAWGIFYSLSGPVDSSWSSPQHNTGTARRVPAGAGCVAKLKQGEDDFSQRVDRCSGRGRGSCWFDRRSRAEPSLVGTTRRREQTTERVDYR